jgi:UDP-glucose 4-epimerase
MKNFKRKVILVTGGAGFIGSHMVDALIKDGGMVLVVDNLSTGNKKNLNPKSKFYKADIQDPKISQIFEKNKPDVVFHFAAQIEARESVKNPINDAKINILGSLNVLENCRKFKVKRIVFASSGGESYDNAEIIPTPESYPSSPRSPYGVAKMSVEKYLDSYFKMYGILSTIVRYGNVYGPRQNPYGGAGVVAIFTNKMINGEQIIIHGEGKQTKDYIFIDDAIEATVRASRENINEIINIATGKETSVIEIYNKLRRIIGFKKEAKYIPLPTGVLKRGVLSIKKAEELINFKPRYDIDKGLRLTVDWFKKNYER